MKNLNVKKVALGLFLAGYAASNAFALQAVSVGTIKGTAPIITNKSDGSAWNITVSKDNDQNLTAVGDKITIKYGLVDKDGDSESSTGLETASTAQILYRKANDATWYVVPGDVTRTQGQISYIIPNQLANAVALGFKMQANTQFGDPSQGDWLVVKDLGSVEDSIHQVTDPNNEIGVGGGVGEGGTVLPGAPGTDKPIGPGTNSNIKIGIFKKGDFTTNYNVSSTALNLGEEFEVRIWSDENGNNAYDANEEILTNNFPTFQWYVTGGNALAGGSAVTTDMDLQGATSTTIALPATNADAVKNWSALPSSTTGAGLQGFQLGVKPTTVAANSRFSL